MELFLTHLRENGIQDTGHPVFKSISALSRGLLKKKNGRDATHFRGCFEHRALIPNYIHSVNQIIFYGAVTNWCEQFGLKEEEKDKRS